MPFSDARRLPRDAGLPKRALPLALSTSPGGADSGAIIAASSDVDMPFVMAMQTGRFPDPEDRPDARPLHRPPLRPCGKSRIKRGAELWASVAHWPGVMP